MRLTRFLAAMGAMPALAGLASADQKASQVHLEVRFLEATSEGLRDLGADIGWGAGLSLNFASGENSSTIPFLSASWDRLTGDNGVKINLSGAMVGARFRTSPKTPLDKTQTAIVAAIGYFNNKHEDDVADDTSKGEGFDVGLEFGPMMHSKSPLWRFLFSVRPDTFGKRTQLMILTASFPIGGK